MRDLNELRKEIDLIDQDLVRLFEKRMDVVLEIADYKKAHHVPIVHTDREKQVIDRGVGLLKNKEYAPALTEWMTKTMALSRACQEKKLQG